MVLNYCEEFQQYQLCMDEHKSARSLQKDVGKQIYWSKQILRRIRCIEWNFPI